MKKNYLERLLLEEPEKVFYDSRLTYDTSEVEAFINQFDNAAPSIINPYVLSLLKATLNFRVATQPEGLLGRLRNVPQNKLDFQAIFNDMNDSLARIQALLREIDFTEKDKETILKALDYSKHSIKQRINSLPLGDKLLPIWEVSYLKKNIEYNN